MRTMGKGPGKKRREKKKITREKKREKERKNIVERGGEAKAGKR